jgi:hypothetical protein
MVPTTDSAFLLFVITGAVLPLLVDLVTRKLAAPRVKALTLLALSLISSGATDFFTQSQTFDIKTWAYGFFYTVVTAGISLFVVTKPTGLSGSNGVVSGLTPGFIGKSGIEVLATSVEPISKVTTDTITVEDFKAHETAGTSEDLKKADAAGD